jgi:hypothetical protein
VKQAGQTPGAVEQIYVFPQFVSWLPAQMRG